MDFQYFPAAAAAARWILTSVTTARPSCAYDYNIRNRGSGRHRPVP